jgi:Tol biopolymer transport system component
LEKEMKNFVRIALLVLVALTTACGTLEITIDRTPTPDLGAMATLAELQTRVATLDPVSQPLTMDSTSETIRLKLLRSQTFWHTVFVDGIVDEYPPEGGDQPLQVSREQLWIDLDVPAFRRVGGPADGLAAYFSVSDGEAILEMDLKSGTSQTRPLPDVAKAVRGYQPPSAVTDFITGHPLAGTMGSPFDDMLLPAGLAQREGSFETAGVEKIAGRECLIVDWFWPNGARPSRYWIDTHTGMILKRQEFGKGGGEILQEEYVIDQIVYDKVFPANLFSLNPATLPQFSDVNGTPAAAVTPAPSVEAGGDPLNEVYFFTISAQHETFELIRLPGSCVVGTLPCPEVERIDVPLPLKFSINSDLWAWSHDGKLAAFTYPSNADGTASSLLVFEPVKKTWTSIVDMPVIDIPMWSHDGKWIAFREQDGAGHGDIYAVHPDGSGLVNLTDSDQLPESDYYIMDGWIANNAIIRPERDPEGRAFLVRVDDGLVRPLFQVTVIKSMFVPSPDGSLLAFDDCDQSGRKHSLHLITPDGSGLRTLVTFTDSTLYPIVWSPDISRLAFVAFTHPDAGAPGSDVYVVGLDGRGLQQVFRGGTAVSIAFSPDGSYLLVEESDSQHVFVVNLETLESHIIQAPGLSLTDGWRSPSWRP